MENNIRKVYGIGETVYDIIFKDGKPVTGHPGGSVFNGMISLGRCGIDAAFISETGNDQVGDLIVSFLEENGLSAEYVNQFEDGKSALALAFLNEKNDAVYDFYKDYPKQRLNLELPKLKKDDILVFGSFFALNKQVRSIVKSLIKQACEAQAIIYYDPNFRSTHLPGKDKLMDTLIENFGFSSFIRGSDEDFGHIFPGKKLEEVYSTLSKYSSNLICTKNKDGVEVFAPSLKLNYNVPQIKPLSTVGAGDNFNAGFVYGLIKYNVRFDNLSDLPKEIWDKLIETAVSFSTEVCLSYENYVSREFAERIKQ